MDKLLDWLIKFNRSTYDPSHWRLTNEQINVLLQDYLRMLSNWHVKREVENDNTNWPIRPSMLGKPAMVIAYNYYHPNTNSHLPNNNARSAYNGYFFELWCKAHIMSLGYNVQSNVTSAFRYFKDIQCDRDVDCHVDMIINDGLIVECKEVNDYYFKQWMGTKTKEGKPDDDRGYLTQASVYSYAFDLPVMWMMGNRLNGEVGFVFLDNKIKELCLDRVNNILDVLFNKTTCWEECFKYMEPEKPNKTKAGYTVPFGMKPIADKVYKLDKKGYVVDYNYPKGYEQYKPSIN